MSSAQFPNRPKTNPQRPRTNMPQPHPVAPLRVAVAGAGYFSRFHYDGWSRIPGVSIVAAADLDATKVTAMAQDFSVPHTFATVSAMLEATPCDVLDIATPPPTHAALVKLGLSRGLTVICQKPFCSDLDEARVTVALADAKPNTLIIHENFRFKPWYRETKRQLEAGVLGEIYQITFRLRPGDGQGPDAYLSRQPYFQKMPRFLIRETAIHFIDTFRYLLGEIDGLSADLRRLNPVIAGEDAALIVFTFRSGARGVFDGNRLADHVADDRRKTMGEMSIEGAKGTLRLDGYGRLWLRPNGTSLETEITFPWDDRGYGGDCVRLFQQHVVQHMTAGGPLETAAADYLRNLEIETSVYHSHQCRRYVTIEKSD
jgi:D-apiose dehydrogenase